MDLSKLKKVIPYYWRVQQAKEYGANCVAYIDARSVMNILDEVVGPENWQDAYKEIDGKLFGGIGIFINDRWVWKWDTGSESNIEAEKGEVSDAFKRAAVKWGPGRFLYDLPVYRLNTVEKGGKYYPVTFEDATKIIYNKDDLTKYINNRLNKKKALTDKAFRQALARIDAGEKDLVDKLRATYALSAAQQNELNTL